VPDSITVDGVTVNLKAGDYWYVVADGRVVYSGNCSYDANDAARRHKGVGVAFDGEPIFDHRVKKAQKKRAGKK
jgi:hypothetical protein